MRQRRQAKTGGAAFRTLKTLKPRGNKKIIKGKEPGESSVLDIAHETGLEFSLEFPFFFSVLFFFLTIFYWFCHISTWIHHRYTRVPHPEPSSFLPPCTIPPGCPSAPAPSFQYRASNLDWRLISYMILYMFQCHSPKSSHPLPLPQSPKDCSIQQHS